MSRRIKEPKSLGGGEGNSSASTMTLGSPSVVPLRRSSPSSASMTAGAGFASSPLRPSTSANSYSSPKPPKRQNVTTSPPSSSFPGNGGGGGVSTASGPGQPIDFSNLPKRTVEDYTWVNPDAIKQIEDLVNTMLQTDSQKDVVRELARRVAPTAEAEDIHLYFRGTPLFETGTLPSGVTYKTMFPKTTPKKGVPKYKLGYALPKLIVAADVQSFADFMRLLKDANPKAINTARGSYPIASQWLADSEVYRRHHGPAAGIVVDLSDDGSAVTSNLLPPGKNLAALKNYEKMIAQQACEDYLRRIYQITQKDTLPDTAKVGEIRKLLSYAPNNLGFRYDVRHLRGGSVAAHYDASEADKRAIAAARSKGKRGGSGSGNSGSGNSGSGNSGKGGPSGGSGSNASTVSMSGSTFGGRARSAYYSHYADYPY